jgi:uncharacterized protein YjbI with pentapeptide repeats
MANEEQLKILKQGIETWNKWRGENRDTKIDLIEADLRGANLKGVYLWEANLREADLRRTNLSEANLNATHLAGANLSRASLLKSSLINAYLKGAKLIEATLNEADLRGARLDFADIRGTDFEQAQFEEATVGSTIFGDTNLNNAIGLEKVVHIHPTNIDNKSIQRSKGNIPDQFLRGCGLSDWEIESSKLYRPGLSPKEINDIVYRIYDLRATRPIQMNSLFISYSHKDSIFVDNMENHLNKKGIRFWRDIHDAAAGRLEKVVDHAMRQNPTVLLVLSENSVQSDWVEHEARSARDLEKELKRDVLCPVALDGAWKDCNWPARLREQIMEYNILDFANWKDESEFTGKFAKLVEGLDLFYKQ